MLTCTDFSGDCCFSCHTSFDVELIAILNDDDTIYANVCCMKINQAELRRDKVTESIEEK